MTDFTTSEVLNEVSKIFTSRIDPGKEGGTLNTDVEYQQLLDLTSVTFLLNNDAIFYLAVLAKNQLFSLVKREVRFVEDMLVALDDLSQIGTPVTDTTTLNNANTALLSLDAASTLQGRPETQRFSDLMDKFAEEYRGNVVSSSTGGLVRPRDNARDVLRTNLDRMKGVHDRLLAGVFALRDILDEFVEQDIPAKVSSTSLTRIRENLNGIITNIETDLPTQNIARSRRTLLTTLASKAAVNIIGTFTDPRELKIRTPLNPIPAALTHTGRVVGDGELAFFTTTAAPWQLPMSDSLSLKANGGSTQVLALNEILGSVLNGRIRQNYDINANERNLHVMVDPVTHQGTITGTANIDGDRDEVTLSTFLPLGFKHLGAPVFFPSYAPTDLDGGLFHRVIVEHRGLRTGTISAFDSTEKIISWGSLSVVEEPNAVLDSTHIGAYVLDSAGERYEITEIISAGLVFLGTIIIPSVRVSVPDGLADPALGVSTVYGQTSAAGGTKFEYSPVRATLPTGVVDVGPTIKTVRVFSGGSRTLGNVIADIQAEGGVFDTYTQAGTDGQKLNRHVKAQASVIEENALALVTRSKQDPHIQIVSNFLNAHKPEAIADVVQGTCHDTLGFRVGEKDRTDLLTAAEFIAQLNTLTDITAELVTTELGAGTSGVVNKDSKQFADFSGAAPGTFVSPGDLVEIKGEFIRGVFQIDQVQSNSTLLLFKDTLFDVEEKDMTYRLFREQVKISSTKTGPDSSLEIVSGPTEMGFPAPGSPVTSYGSIPQFEAVDKLGNFLSFSGVVPGDFLRLVGSQVEYEITAVGSTRLTLATGIPSNIKKRGFEIRSGASKEFSTMNASLDTYTTSPNLLKKNDFDVDLEAVDNAVTLAILPGQNFASSRNQAKQILAELLSILSDDPQRSGEYTAEIPTAPDNLARILREFTAPEVPAVDRILDSLQERKYDRAMTLLQTGRIAEFYATTAETGSFGGAVLAAARTVDRDLPTTPSSASAVDKSQNVSAQSLDSINANQVFTDFEDGPGEISE